MISVKLKVVGGKHAGQVITLSQSKFLIGREEDCQLRPNSELVSRHHCIFTVDDFSVRLRDLGSTNGTLVNGERIRKETVLQPSDRVVVGSLEFELFIDHVAETPAPAPPVKDAPTDETIVQAGSETLNEMPALSPAQAQDQGQETPQQQPAEPATPPAPAPPAAEQLSDSAVIPPENQTTGDTTVIAQPIMMPGQTPYQPMMPPMGYPPQMYQGYPYPGVPQQPMPMYPQPGYPPAPGFAQAPVPAPAQPAAPAATPDTAQQEVSLPDPAETGAREEPPKPAPEPSAEGDAATEEAPKQEASNQSAAAIIQQHRQRRPGG